MWQNQCPAVAKSMPLKKSEVKSMCGEINCGEFNAHPIDYSLEISRTTFFGDVLLSSISKKTFWKKFQVRESSFG